MHGEGRCLVKTDDVMLFSLERLCEVAAGPGAGCVPSCLHQRSGVSA